jgi:hypothetical protein
MINFTAISHNVLAAVGALILSTTFVAAAVGPAEAIEATTGPAYAAAANLDRAQA